MNNWNWEFERMDRLDSDDNRLNFDGRNAERDIVRFVSLNQFLARNRRYGLGKAYIKSQADLVKAVFAEIPYQLTSLVESCGLKSKIKTQVNINDYLLH